MLSKNRIKYIRSLEMKKYRKAEKAFLAEGNKLVNDLLGHFSCKLLIATAQWLEAHPLLLAQETIEVSAEELARASLLKTRKRCWLYLNCLLIPMMIHYPAIHSVWHWMTCKTRAT